MSYFAIMFETDDTNFSRVEDAIHTVSKGECQKISHNFWIVKTTIHPDAKKVRDYIKNYLKLDFDDKVFVVAVKNDESPWASWGLEKKVVDWLTSKP
ncbi:hypothetical protein GCM10027155_15960 [Acinetobacter apis]|uniref:Uncharacterized protein n=1 Tax=Acinetobacter apis TaxID=1229165 RepID=A0A217EH40_9GAMM|nr:hypothetical protein [Acinetobacter apis]SNQ29664.1 hypothetical protein SAMN05444584_1626 [Acinetobacter apis]